MTERKVLYADEGKYLTNGEVYGKVIFLSETDDTTNYTEITDEQYKQIMTDLEVNDVEENLQEDEI